MLFVQNNQITGDSQNAHPQGAQVSQPSPTSFQNKPIKKKIKTLPFHGAGGDSGKYATSMNFFSIKPLNFKKTPIRHRELTIFNRILAAPQNNVPLLLVERDEDCFPLLSLYAQQFEKPDEKLFSVTSTDFGMSYIDPATHEDIKSNMNLAGLVVDLAIDNGQIPVYSNIASLSDSTLLGKFVNGFLKKKMPAVVVMDPTEKAVLDERMAKDKFLMGGLENPKEPYQAVGMARFAPIEIEPMSLAEKKIYFRYHGRRLAVKNALRISDKALDYLTDMIDRRSEHASVFFDYFQVLNQSIVRTLERDKFEITKECIAESFPKMLPPKNPMKALAHLDTRLKKRIFGQDQAIETAHEIILSSLDDETRTKPTVLGFFGPSGVGKTALAEEISLALTNQPVVTFNMSEYADDFKVSQLTGSSKGYVDSDEDGLLAKTIKENPKAVILLDEFEKAHPKVQQMFLGIFDKGVMNDNHSGKIDMSQSTIILTSNAGVRSNQKVGFGSPENVIYEADEKLISDSFHPELLGRMDARIIFNPLSNETLGKIVDKFMDGFNPRFKKLGLQVSLSKKARQELITKGQDPKMGARPLLTLMRQKIKTPIEIGVFKKKIKRGSHVLIQSVENRKMDILPFRGRNVQKTL